MVIPSTLGIASVGTPVPGSWGRSAGAGPTDVQTVVDGIAVDGMALDGVVVDGMALDGMALDGMALDGMAIDGIAVDVSALDVAAGGVTANPSTTLGLIVGGLALAILGLAVQDDEDPIGRLIRKVRRAAAGEDVTFDVDRDDELGELAAAIGEMVGDRDAGRASTTERFRRRLAAIMTDTELDDGEKLDRLLELGCERLKIGNGLVTAIDVETGRYEVERAVGDGFVDVGTVTDLETTFCGKTIESEDVLAIFDATGEGYADDPGYREWGIRSYVGVKILVDGELYGTVCFVDDAPRSQPFTADERVFVDLLGRWASHVIERRDREAELERQRSFMDDVLDAIDDVFYVIDRNGQFLRWNRSFRELTGYEDDEIGEMHALDFFPESSWPTITAGMEEVFETGVGRLEAPVLTKEGETVEYEFVAVEIERPDGTPVLTGIGRDISARKQYERELERTTDLLQQAGRIGKFGGWELDLSGERPALTWTDELYEIHGLSPDDPLDYETAFEYFHPEDRDHLRARIERAIETGRGYDLELRARRPDGEYRWVRSLGEVVTDEAGEVVKLRGAVQDISRRKEREYALETLHESTRGLLDATDRQEAGRIVVDAAESALDVAAVGVFLYDDQANSLQPAAVSTAFEDRVAVPAAIGPHEDSPVWHAFVTDSLTVIDGTTVDGGGSADRDISADGDESAEDDVADGDASVEDDAADGDVSVEDDPADDDVSVEDDAADDHSSADGVSTADRSAADDALTLESSIEHGLVIPIGAHGVCLAVSEGEPIDADTRRLVETLVASGEVALDRIENAAELRARDAELAARNERLRRQIRINETIRSVDRTLVGATSQASLESAVCEKLVEGEDVAFAWIGGLDAAGDRVVPRAWAGGAKGYLDADVFATDARPPEPAVATATGRDPTLVENVAQQVQSEPWRRSALAAGFQSAVAVPLSLEDHSYGVLAVYASESRTFGDLERTVFAELGESIANAITAVSTKQALHADTLVSLTLRLEDATDPLVAIAAAVGCPVAYEGLATHGEDEARVFLRVVDADRTAVTDALADRHAVADYRLVSESADGDVYEVTVRGPLVVGKLVRHGAHPRSITADAAGLDVEVDLPVGADVRAFVEMLEEEFTVELRSRREVSRSLRTRQGVVEEMLDALTDRQREVLHTAYLAGFFNWPRDTTGEELATTLDVSQPTVNRHLRLAEQAIVDQLFAEDSATD